MRRQRIVPSCAQCLLHLARGGGSANLGFKKIVIACHSEYVMNGISSWILTWKKNEWKTNTGTVVENLDLWMTLDVKLRDMEKHEMLIQFWRIPQGLNEADVYAKAGAVSTVSYI